LRCPRADAQVAGNTIAGESNSIGEVQAQIQKYG
jgi:hypothetical protein